MQMQRLLEIDAMIRGSFGRVHRKCGHPTCWCSEGVGHPVDRINYSDDGRSRTKAVAPEDVEWARQMTQNYKRFRKHRQALRSLEKKINRAVDEYEVKVVSSTARKRNYVT